MLLPVGCGTLWSEDGRIATQLRHSLPSGSPLNCVILCLLRHGAMRCPARGEGRGASRRSLLGVAWVDDFSFYRWVRPHPRCAGLAGGCAVCQEGLEEAKELDAFWMELCGSLGVPLNLLKRQLCGQSVEYAGFVFDTWGGLMLISHVSSTRGGG